MASQVTIDLDIRMYIEDVLNEANKVDNKKRKRKNAEEDSRLKDFDLVDKLHQTKKSKMNDVCRRSQGPTQIKNLYQPKNKIQGPARNGEPEYANFNYPCLMGPITFKYIGRTSEPILDFTYLLNKTSEDKGTPKGIVESGEVPSKPLEEAERIVVIADDTDPEDSGSPNGIVESGEVPSEPLEEAEGIVVIDDDIDPEESGSPKGIVESGEESSELLEQPEGIVDSPMIECIVIDDDTDPEESGNPKDIVKSGEESLEPLEEAEGNVGSPMIECMAIDDDTDPEESGNLKGIVESGEESSEPLEEAEGNVDSPMTECMAIDDDTDPSSAEESELNQTDIFVNDEEGDMVIVLDD
ncbi:unnamed protein product [Hermetia illucens]|uniref:Uncharacterized protein n=1 Tax=Hermetia illucens TaxID=343691 RepID=A0A7R8UYE2_HERIL|nr:unnamed protein product [Hermetia illucens]